MECIMPLAVLRHLQLPEGNPKHTVAVEVKWDPHFQKFYGGRLFLVESIPARKRKLNDYQL
jgi:hypothetical protein